MEIVNTTNFYQITPNAGVKFRAVTGIRKVVDAAIRTNDVTYNISLKNPRVSCERVQLQVCLPCANLIEYSAMAKMNARTPIVGTSNVDQLVPGSTKD